MPNRYLPDVRARAVQMVFEHQGSYETQVGAIAAIAPQIGCIPQTLSGLTLSTEEQSSPIVKREATKYKTVSRNVSTVAISKL